ncbi:amidohydrolase [Candidatus Bathyarchaeota archaeon]|nr:amidohydrolase [Candidatus Bathyarchaeota archaeon]
MYSEKFFVFNWIDEHSQRIINISDSIWRLAELGLMEYKSSKVLSDELNEAGFQIEYGVAGLPTAFTASWGKGKPVIGVMGEYDALPGLSQDIVPFKKPLEGAVNGHGCGHNIHGASGLAGILAVKKLMEKNNIKGTLKYFGCPAEESASGKVWMVREGVFKGVDAVLSHHPSTMNVAPLSSSLANNSVKFHFYGKTSHAASSPEQGRSALDAVELMNVGVNFLREHVIHDARVHYIIEEGGGQPNVVPDYARSWYLIRAPERAQVEEIYNRILAIAKGAELMTSTTHKVEFIKGVYNKIPNKTLSECVTSNMRMIGLPNYNNEELIFAEKISESIPKEAKIEELRKSKRPGWEEMVDWLIDVEVPNAWNEGEVSHGSTDVSDVSWQAPTMEFSTATYVLGTPGHSWQVVAQSGSSMGHKSLLYASKIIAASIIDILLDNEVLEKAWKEHEKRIGGRKYVPPIPEELKPPLNLWQK